MSRPGSNAGGAQDPTEEAPYTGRRGGTAENAGLRAPRRGLREPGHNHVLGSDDLKISSRNGMPQGSCLREPQPWALASLAEFLSKCGTSEVLRAHSGHPCSED